jgi:two-component system, LytTR family, sensor kinase
LAANIFSGRKEKLILAAVFSGWWCIWGLLHIAVLQDIGINPLQAMADGVISYLLLAAFCLLVINNMRYYLPKREKYLYVLVISIALTALWLLLIRVCLRVFFKQDTEYIEWLRHTSTIRFAFGFLMIGCITMLSLLWFSQRAQKEETERRADTERMAKDAELNKLRQQLQPHFLFNSLNSISALTGSQPEKARHMIQQLADLLRGTLRNENQLWTSFEEELKYLQLYLDIEKVRFGHRLQTMITNDDDVLQMKLPSMLLQPLVENAIKFGLYDTLGEVTISIDAKKINNTLEVTVINPFDAKTATPVKGTGFGLASIKRRLFLLFARHDLLQIKQEELQFISSITIPQPAHDKIAVKTNT